MKDHEPLVFRERECVCICVCVLVHVRMCLSVCLCVHFSVSVCPYMEYCVRGVVYILHHMRPLSYKLGILSTESILIPFLPPLPLAFFFPLDLFLLSYHM